MSIGPLGTIGSIAAIPLAQGTVADADRVRHDGANRAREAASQQASEKAEGIDVAAKEQAASDRDADGRRIWEQKEKVPDDASAENEQHETPAVRDPFGDRGSQLDLSG